MFGIASYLTVAMITAATVFLIAEWVRQPGTRVPDHPGIVALAAGLLWPVILLGLAQCGLMLMAHSRWGRRPAPSMRIRVGASAEST